MRGHTTIDSVDIPGGNSPVALGAASRDFVELNDPTRLISTGRDAPPRGVRAWHPLLRHGASLVSRCNVLTMLLAHTKNIALNREHPPRWVKSLMVRRQEQRPVPLVTR